MTLSDRLRAIADILDLLRPAGLENQTNSIDDNDSLEISKEAYDFCLKFSKGQEALQILKTDGMNIAIYSDGENIDYNYNYWG